MMNKIKEIVSKNYDVFDHDFKSISKWKKMKVLFMSISDAIFFYSNLILMIFSSIALFKPNFENSYVHFGILFLWIITCVSLIITPVITGWFDKYSTIRKLTHFRGCRKAFNLRLMENELSLESLQVLSKNLTKDEMKKIFDEKNKIDFNSLYFMEIKKERGLIENKNLSEKSVNKKESQFKNLLDALYKE